VILFFQPELLNKLKETSYETVLEVSGTVIPRPDGQTNPVSTSDTMCWLCIA